VTPPQSLVEALTHTTRVLAEVLLALTTSVLGAGAEAPKEVSPTNGLETGALIEVTGVQLRPFRTGEPHRVELTCVQLGPLPAVSPFVLWATVPPGGSNPYQTGQRYAVLLRAA
jgi:hypothetical protein